MRAAIMQALCAGAVGTYDALAAHAGVAPAQAQITLGHLAREGKAVAEPDAPQGAPRRGRPRAVYALAATNPAPANRWVLDRTLGAAWR